jgi:Tol biopolymer transport system component
MGLRARRRIALAAVIVAIGTACQAARPLGTPSATSSTPVPTQTALVSSEPSNATAAPEQTPELAAVRTAPLSELRGDWVFVAKRIPKVECCLRFEMQIWAIPLEGGSPRQVASWDSAFSVVESIGSDANVYLRRQFSPDGRRLVLSVNGLVVIDLPSGRATSIGRQGFSPAWSKDGSRIAYTAWPRRSDFVPDSRVVVVAADGGPAVELPARDGTMASALEWSADGGLLLVTSSEGIDFVDASSGQSVRHLSRHSASFAHWRQARPQIALSTVSPTFDRSQLLVMEDATGAERVLAESTDTFDAGGSRSVLFSYLDPRWNPASNELLYIVRRNTTGGPGGFATHVVDASSGRDTRLSITASEATWTWDGGRIVYIRPDASFSRGVSLRIANRDGSGDRELLASGADATLYGLASLRY